jgi:transcriptional regulator of arginine metabolism
MAEASGGARKLHRRERILELIASDVIDTQEELALRLHAEGFPVTQATVSRDIRDLRLVKVPVGDGRSRYAPWVPPDPDARLLRLFRDFVVSQDASENIVVLNTLPGTAAGVAEAVDKLGLPEVIGTLAGERTVFVVIKPKRDVPLFLARVRRLLETPPVATGHEADPGPPERRLGPGASRVGRG